MPQKVQSDPIVIWVYLIYQEYLKFTDTDKVILIIKWLEEQKMRCKFGGSKVKLNAFKGA